MGVEGCVFLGGGHLVLCPLWHVAHNASCVWHLEGARTQALEKETLDSDVASLPLQRLKGEVNFYSSVLY